MAKSKSVSLPFYLSMLFLVVLALLYFFHPGFHAEIHKGFEVFTNDVEGDESKWVNSFGYWGPVIVIVGFLLQMFLIFIPSILLIIASIVAFGAWEGSLVALIGVFVASTVGFLMGRFLSEKTLDHFIDDQKKEKLDYYVDKFGIWAIVISRFNPFLSLDALSFVAGIAKMSFWKFILGTLVGIVPLILLLNLFGNNQEYFMDWLLWFSVFSLLCLLAIVYYDYRNRQKKNRS